MSDGHYVGAKLYLCCYIACIYVQIISHSREISFYTPSIGFASPSSRQLPIICRNLNRFRVNPQATGAFVIFEIRKRMGPRKS